MPLSRHNQLLDTRTPVYIDILPESSSRWSSSSTLYQSPIGLHPSNTPCHMRDIDPTVTFVSTSVVIAKSSYIILLDGAPIHSEDTKLECIGPYFAGSVNPPDNNPLLYGTALVPRYWELLCKSPDPTIYTILHDVYRPTDPAPCLPRCLGRRRPVLIFSAIYHFRYSVPVCTPPSFVTPCHPYQANPPSVINTAHAYYNSLEPVYPPRHPMHPCLSDHESLQSHEDSSQNPLNEQFTLDSSFMGNVHDLPEAISKGMMPQSSASGFPQDIHNYIM
ncbi:uncharacterized protein F5891DRAFT_294658 [Suillus fuscotomentosus]|uniref:Uncharacterized protein n=1 Tax=Suillus fuscotomentosus TaxID=1912939 RepID=A0AAD4HM49_9AGAM|nr:uncharacterized protein F5891DRAFT_294658 [Suillus fuscotomentosus]KAG1900494.1 hypothetical protein F5891DRAFT_294658 [Suillus fuscotomentosus]